MRYWKLRDSIRVIAVNCQMTDRWQEITKEEFTKAREIEDDKMAKDK
jgi:hypothetical protein